MSNEISLVDVVKRIGEEIGLSKWITVDQSMINAFADATDDHQFIHVDPERAASSPFGGTIAHGFLTLSLLSAMNYDALPVIREQTMGINYGFDKIRFMSPVRSGKRVRGRFKLLELVEKRPGQWQQTNEFSVEIEGEEKPAMIAEWIAQIFV